MSERGKTPESFLIDYVAAESINSPLDGGTPIFIGSIFNPYDRMPLAADPGDRYDQTTVEEDEFPTPNVKIVRDAMLTSLPPFQLMSSLELSSLVAPASNDSAIRMMSMMAKFDVEGRDMSGGVSKIVINRARAKSETQGELKIDMPVTDAQSAGSEPESTPQIEYPLPPETRAPTAHRFRTGRLRKGAVGDFIKGLQSDTDTKDAIGLMTKHKLDLTPWYDRYDTRYRALTPFLSGIMSQPDARKSFMKAIDETVTAESDALKEQARESGGLKVDILLVGAGLQASVAAAQMRLENPKLSVLCIDEKPQIGGQFRSYGARPTFRINSRSHRPQLEDSVYGEISLPGELGNLNSFGDTAPLQMPDITTETYPTNVDMGDVAAVNLFLSAPVMTETKHVSCVSSGTDQEIVTVADIITGQEYKINAQRVVFITGAGERQKIEDAGNVWTAEEVLAHFGNEDNPLPMETFAGKTIAVIGGGDSGKIIVELLSRLGPQAAYGKSVAQFGNPQSIAWYGVDFTNQDEYCEQNRSRYSQLGAFISNRFFARGGRNVIPMRVKVEAVYPYGRLGGNSIGVQIADSNGFTLNYDMVIDARTLVKSNAINNDVDDLPAGEIRLRVSELGNVAVGKELFRTSRYIAGPAAELPLSALEKSTFSPKIKQNGVSVWANTPRVERLAEYIARTTSPRT